RGKIETLHPQWRTIEPRRSLKIRASLVPNRHSEATNEKCKCTRSDMHGSFSRTKPLRPVMSLNKMLTMSRVHARREEPNCQDISTDVLEIFCRTIESHERTSTPQLNTPVAMNESHEFD